MAFPLFKNTVSRPGKTDMYVQSAHELSVLGPALYSSYLEHSFSYENVVKLITRPD